MDATLDSQWPQVHISAMRILCINVKKVIGYLLLNTHLQVSFYNLENSGMFIQQIHITTFDYILPLILTKSIYI